MAKIHGVTALGEPSRVDGIPHRCKQDRGYVCGIRSASMRTGVKDLVTRAVPLPIAAQRRLDHGALAALLVPTLTPAIIAATRTILTAHNALEEGPGGLYEMCEPLAGTEAEGLLAQLQAGGPICRWSARHEHGAPSARESRIRSRSG
jgi:hypothetical protein